MPRKPMPWFRFYVEAVHDRKLRRLKPDVRWLFVACLAAARQSPKPGWLMVGEDDPMDVDDLADFAYMPRRQVEEGTAKLTSAGVVAFDAALECWFIPNWDERQYESDNSTSRTKKHRAKAKEGTGKERSNDVPRNGEAPFKERPASVTETEGQTDFVPTERDFFKSSPALAVVRGPRLAAGGWEA